MNASATHTAGTCTLVGAGPGDPELLTIKALKAIQNASVLLVDNIWSRREIVNFASPTARIVYVGKRGGCKSAPQAFIEKLMEAEVRQGERVVRLKGGDPFIFGRGGEEVEHLRRAGIAVQVINGITAGLAGLSSLGAPLTHREHAHGVVFHRAMPSPETAALTGVLWPARHMRRNFTLVIYMGVSAADHISAELQAGGLPALTPAAIIQHASLPQQRHAITNLQNLADTLHAQIWPAPACW